MRRRGNIPSPIDGMEAPVLSLKLVGTDILHDLRNERTMRSRQEAVKGLFIYTMPKPKLPSRSLHLPAGSSPHHRARRFRELDRCYHGGVLRVEGLFARQGSTISR